MTLPKFKKKDKRNGLQEEIDRLIDEMACESDQTSDFYKSMQESLGRLIDLYNKRYPNDRRDIRIEKISPNTVLVVLGGLLEIGLIMTYERGHVIATKAFSRLLRGRV